MRNIKFRAYIKNENKRTPSEINKMVEVKSLHLGSRKAIIGYSKNSNNYGNYSITFDEIELMQYTGLKDKNGKEIYEGDIITNGDSNIKYVIEWEDTGLRGRQWNNRSYIGLRYWNERLEVIGNIYENSELLEE